MKRDSSGSCEASGSSGRAFGKGMNDRNGKEDSKVLAHGDEMCATAEPRSLLLMFGLNGGLNQPSVKESGGVSEVVRSRSGEATIRS